MMVLDGMTNIHSTIEEVVKYLRPNDLLVLNNTKVLQARIQARRLTGGKVELLFLLDQPDEEGWLRALVKPSRRIKTGEHLIVEGMNGVSVEMGEHLGDGEWTLRSSVSIQDIMSAVGKVPIPPYLRRENELSDQERYQRLSAQWLREIVSRCGAS